MESLASKNSLGAIEWLRKEGDWEDLPSIGKASSSAYEKMQLFGVSHLYNSVGDELKFKE